jgi:hypothetical protein
MLGAVLAIMTFMGITNHMGWEIFPGRLVHSRLGHWLITASHHTAITSSTHAITGFTSASGIACAAPIAAFRALSLVLAAPALLGRRRAIGRRQRHVTGLRSAKGQVLACLTARASAFPSCEHDPAARTATVPAAGRVELALRHGPAGALCHRAVP